MIQKLSEVKIDIDNDKTIKRLSLDDSNIFLDFWELAWV